MTTTLRARFDGKVLVPNEPVDLPTDRELVIHVDPAQQRGHARGTWGALQGIVGCLDAEDARAFRGALEESSRVDPDGW